MIKLSQFLKSAVYFSFFAHRVGAFKICRADMPRLMSHPTLSKMCRIDIFPFLQFLAI